MDARTIIFLIIGLLLLLVSGKFLVESSVNIAKKFRIPPAIIGLTIVAFGTSAPELLVSVQAAILGHPDMAMGNVIGSNISNIFLVLAITAVIFPLPVKRNSVILDWPIMMAVTLLLAAFLMNLEISRIEGIVFLILLGGYILLSVLQTKRNNNRKKEEVVVLKQHWIISVLIFTVSCVGLAFGADMLVSNASIFAEYIGVSERVISISMVALGTSLPELATSIIAAFKKQAEISIGNIIGSNIMNILSVLGITSIIQPIGTVKEVLRTDVPWMLGSAILLFLFMIPAKRGKLSRWEGAVMLMAYAFYIYFIFKS